MATTDLTVGGTGKLNAASEGHVHVVKATFNAVDNPLAAQNDVAQLINVPAESMVLSVKYKITQVEGAARLFSIGDGADINGYITTITANVLGNAANVLALAEGAPNTLVGYGNGKYYPTADTIDLNADTAGGLTGCIIEVIAVIADMSL
ncbi:MAG: hypothetical protein KAS93_07930 [Gammaproteobacteria bacterium]|nr:hypothetical protein [Gammaproteobacteria bacterium]